MHRVRVRPYSMGPFSKDQVKPFTLHCSLLLLIFGYAIAGGLIFNKLEAEATEEQKRNEWEEKRHCVVQVLERGREPLGEPYWPTNNTAHQIMHCFEEEPDERAQWGLVTATLYGFGIVTTLGYNRIAPITLSGRLFCVLYGICGIPMTMIIIANIGQYLNQFAGATRKNIETYRERRRRSRISINGEDIPESSIEVMSIGLLVAFLLYVCFGAVLLPLLNGKFDFYNGIYFNFLCLTAIDFGQLVPYRWAFLPITFLYVCIGLAITTIAIDVGSEYMKKLHHFGKRVKNVASAKIWFGGKTLRVKDLLHAVGKKCGIDPAEIDRIDLENIVERAVALNEGREPPPDTNEEPPPPKEPRPPTPEEQKPLLEEKPPPPRDPPPPPPAAAARATRPSLKMLKAREKFFGGPPVESAVPLENGATAKRNHMDRCAFVAIDIDQLATAEGAQSEQAFAWSEPPKVVMRPLHGFVQPCPEIASPDQLTALAPPTVIVDDATQRVVDLEPKRFREKKEKYARDPRKLYETYQEEWGRLERLSDKRLGPRRKSVLALNVSGGGVRTREPSLEGGQQLTPSTSSAHLAGGSDGQSDESGGNNPPQPHDNSSSRPSRDAQRAAAPTAKMERELELYNSSSQSNSPHQRRTVSPPPSQIPTFTTSAAATSRASASPRALRPPPSARETPPRSREVNRRNSSTPRKLSFTKFRKFGDMVAHPTSPDVLRRKSGSQAPPEQQ